LFEPHRQNGVASANSANAVVAAAIATSRRACSPPPSNPAANARLASHSSRSNSREFALALDCLALAMAYAAHARLQSFSVQLALGVSK
jgi:hypothetical protein